MGGKREGEKPGETGVGDDDCASEPPLYFGHTHTSSLALISCVADETNSDSLFTFVKALAAAVLVPHTKVHTPSAPAGPSRKSRRGTKSLSLSRSLVTRTTPGLPSKGLRAHSKHRGRCVTHCITFSCEPLCVSFKDNGVQARGEPGKCKLACA